MFWLFSYDTTGWKAELPRSFIIKLQTTFDLSIVRFCYIAHNSAQTLWGWQTGQSLSQNHTFPLSFWDALRILGETKSNSRWFFSPDVASLSLSVVIQISNSAQQVRTVAWEGREGKEGRAGKPKSSFPLRTRCWCGWDSLGEGVRKKAGQGGRNQCEERVISKD